MDTRLCSSVLWNVFGSWRGTKQNVEKGWSLIRGSIRSNKDVGCLTQAQCYRHGYGVQKNLSTAIRSYKKAIRVVDFELGKYLAHYALATRYETRQGLKRNYSKAFENYNQAADVMNRAVQWKVGLWCESGIGVEKDNDRAVEYFRLAANSGHQDAQIKSYHYYMEGNDAQRNLMSSFQIIEASAQNKVKNAKHFFSISW